ncbi:MULTISPECIES: outer membrane beta-barrel protein [Proteiniphilum]|jgi:hypothetical protein|uniref:outer membrane beta-barrel protein n=2 Tax=Dysgonomonadaceae TaxID=2005520 RepID=UPI001EE9DAC9|nr:MULTISPECIES: outer membrane beta-barrel protein [Proteiniphilum]ULB34964.1 outer membrane beta-barrel protein [Proteiniphilum propionicum]
MRSYNRYKVMPDDFSREVGDKLREHRIPVTPDLWKSLADRLPRQGKLVFAYWLWAAAGVVAVVALLVFFLNPYTDEHAVHMSQERPVDMAKSQPAASAGESISTHIEEPVKDPLLTQNTQLQKRTKKKVAVSGVVSDISERQKGKELDVPEIYSEGSRVSILPVELEEAAKSDGTIAHEVVNTYPADSIFVENDLPNLVQEQPGLRSLIAALGSGGTPLDLSFGGYDASNPIYDSPIPGGEFNSGDGLGSGGNYKVLSPGDYTDIEHRPPVSFSLTADFPVGKNVGLETGLSYTYLFSRFRRNDHFIYRGTLQQHYIGIPLTLRYTIWQDGPRSIYLLGGATIEKGIRAFYKQEIEGNGGIVHHTHVYNRIAGLQFSAQGGAGFSYRLQNNLHLFGEPRLLYYFRNNQPMSARTENPLIFGLNIGVRIQFK